MTLAIPQDKLDEVMEAVGRCVGSPSSIPKWAQLGPIWNTAWEAHNTQETVQIRDTTGWYVRFIEDVKAKLDWFLEFPRDWKGRALIPGDNPSLFIQVDACLSGIYGPQTGEEHTWASWNANINKLEAIIVVVVMSQSAGCSGTELGTCQEPHTTRMCWMVQAVLDVMITFEVIKGVDKKLWWQTHSAGHTFPINRQRNA